MKSDLNPEIKAARIRAAQVGKTARRAPVISSNARRPSSLPT